MEIPITVATEIRVMKVLETSVIAYSHILQMREPRPLTLKLGLFTGILDSECPQGMEYVSLISAASMPSKVLAPSGGLVHDS